MCTLGNEKKRGTGFKDPLALGSRNGLKGLQDDKKGIIFSFCHLVI